MLSRRVFVFAQHVCASSVAPVWTLITSFGAGHSFFLETTQAFLAQRWKPASSRLSLYPCLFSFLFCFWWFTRWQLYLSLLALNAFFIDPCLSICAVMPCLVHCCTVCRLSLVVSLSLFRPAVHLLLSFLPHTGVSLSILVVCLQSRV